MDNIWYHFLLVLLLLQPFMAGFAMAATDLTIDQSSLLEFKHQILDPYNILATNWSTTSSVCHWVGISCSSRHGRVAVLDLSDMGLNGTIAPQLGNLSFLVSLNLRSNNFHGNLPKELIKLRRLKLIDLSYNSLNGEVPSWFGALHKIKHMVLSNNNFKGTIPPNLANMSNLETLDLGFNSILGKIPNEIGNLQKINTFGIAFNTLSGSIPSSFFNISSLQLISLSYNQLSGSLPDSMCYHLPQLEEFILTENQISGYIPSSIGECSKLQVFSLYNNRFNGNIPRSIGNLTSLKGLYLDGNNLEGEIPLEIGNLLALETLSIANMSLIGSIPTSIVNISCLKEIYLYNLNLSGIIPDNMCSHLHNLNVLDISENEFSGHIPSNIGECSNLQNLSLFYNRFNGPIPTSIGNLTKLKQIDISGNGIEGEIPREIGNLNALEIFYAYDMHLSGPIPSSIFNIFSIKEIALENNTLSGKLPSMILASNLEKLYLWGNNLSGHIPDSISNASKLRTLQLHQNFFGGHIPDTLGNLTSLEDLRLWSNRLTTKSPTHEWSFLSSLTKCRNLKVLQILSNPLKGIIPNSISNLSTSLQDFNANGCQIKGRIPMEIGSLNNIIRLSLSQNELSGPIPATIGRLQKIQGLFLHDNKLQGFVPYNICHLEKVSDLSLSRNMLQGPILPCLGDLPSLRSIDLSSNKFYWTIPFNFWNLKDILQVDLSLNYLNGSVPQEIGNLKVLIYLNLSRNLLSGDIPSTIGSLSDLQTLSLSSNRFQGLIPASLGDLKSLETLDLSNNNFSGIIPKSLGELPYLSYFNVAFNRLEGEIPTEGCFKNFTSKSFMKNYALCGSPKLEVPPCKNNTHGPSKRTGLHVLAYVLPPIASIVLIATFIIILQKCQNNSTNLSVEQGSTILEIHSRNLYNRLIQATEGFNESNLLGSGSFGSVYIGKLSNGRNVAVKVFNLQLEGAFRSFDVECEVMQNILHRNLVKVISCCSCIDFKALVLEFMPNGSLEKWLYSRNYFLDILQRINIMIDVASAIEYLHLGHPNPIVHCDLKPSNILLDIEMVAHVGDFGIAKLLGEAESVKQTLTLATIGYMAPEYGSTGIVSVKSDVYSYGILLLETFTGKKPTNEIFAGEMNMKRWVEESISNGIIGVVDSRLLHNEAERHFLAKANCISSIMRLALDCLAEFPAERKDMKDVVSALKKIKIKFINNGTRV